MKSSAKKKLDHCILKSNPQSSEDILDDKAQVFQEGYKIFSKAKTI